MAGKHRLSAAFVKSSTEGKHCDGAGLWLHRRADGGAQWFLRITVHRRRREMGLGSLSDVPLKKARELADHWRKLAASGIDPIKERERQARELARADNTLRKIAAEAFEVQKAELKGDGKAGRWFSPLELHVLPKLGKVPVEEIDQRDIRDALAPIWHTKAETARKALNRLGIVLRHAAALGLDVDLQATDKAKALLGKSRHTPKNIAAMRWPDVPAFYGTAAYMLVNGVGKARARRDGLARPAAAWRLLFLTSGEVRLGDHMREVGKRTRAGQEIRLADLPADAGAGHGLFGTSMAILTAQPSPACSSTQPGNVMARWAAPTFGSLLISNSRRCARVSRWRYSGREVHSGKGRPGTQKGWTSHARFTGSSHSSRCFHGDGEDC